MASYIKKSSHQKKLLYISIFPIKLFLFSTFGPIEGYFFSDDGNGKIIQKSLQKFSIPPRSGIIDILSQYKEMENVEKIFVISGPANFTSLRNISVFVNTYQTFSKKNITIFPISTGKFFKILYPKFSKFILSVGRRESFVFNVLEEYKKYKNPEILENFSLQEYAGFFSHQVLEKLEENFSPPLPLLPEKFLQKITDLENSEKIFPVKTLEIDYGSLPNIG